MGTGTFVALALDALVVLTMAVDVGPRAGILVVVVDTLILVAFSG